MVPWCRQAHGIPRRSHLETKSKSCVLSGEDERMNVMPAAPSGHDDFVIAGRTLNSRLLLGSGGYPNRQVLLDALEAARPAMVTVAIRRISLEGYAESLVDLLDDFVLLPNTAGCTTVRDAVLTAELGREALGTDWVKLEVIGDRETQYPDVEQLLRATEELVKAGFTVLPYCNEDPDRK